MTLYSLNGGTPAPLPFRIRLSDGRTRTDPETFTEAEIAEAGLTEAPAAPAYDAETERLVWDGAWIVEALPPPPIAPVTPRQIRLALTQQGMMGAVDAYVSNLDEAAAIEWEYATEVERDNALIAAAQVGLGLTDQQADDLFRLAATL